MKLNLTFFLLSGVVLIASGTLQAFIRPRDPKEGTLQRILNRATVRALVFIAVGLLAVLVGLGKVALPGVG